ncbi:MAG: ABC transporter permease [Pyrinomonadaceae bacterium]
MVSLAFRNLFYDKIRSIVTIIGIVFSVVLSSIQLGLFVGFQAATASIVENSNADVWISSQNLVSVENGAPFSERKIYKVLSTPNVEEATKNIVQFGTWKRPDGAETGVEIVGFDLKSEMLRPWNIVEGSWDALREPDAVIVDSLYKEKLGVSRIGETVEIRGYKAKIVGFTHGIRTFTTSPAVFTSFKNAQNYFGLPENQTLYILVKATPNANLQQLKRDLQANVADVDVYTRAEITAKQQNYWMFGTGAGVTVLIAAGLGLLVGVVVVAQTIYSATVDHIKEYGTLKAMGATNFYLYRIIIAQALISGVIGYALAIGVSLFISFGSLQGTTAIIIPWQLAIGLFGLTMLMCALASIVSINKVTRLDPAMVFKG